MIIEVDHCFKKDFKKINNLQIEQRIISKINTLEAAKCLNTITNLKKMRGFENFYRIRIGDYRIGLELHGNTITLIRIRHRKDIYNIFP